MVGPRLLLGAAIGGALVYFLDPDHGPGRRDRVRSWWEQNREPVMNTAASAASTAQARASEVSDRVSEVSDRVGEKVTELSNRVKKDAKIG
jgi:gas vesicle protein